MLNRFPAFDNSDDKTKTDNNMTNHFYPLKASSLSQNY